MMAEPKTETCLPLTHPEYPPMTTQHTADGRKLWELTNGEWLISFCEAANNKINVMSESQDGRHWQRPRFLSREQARRVWRDHVADGYKPR